MSGVDIHHPMFVEMFVDGGTYARPHDLLTGDDC